MLRGRRQWYGRLDTDAEGRQGSQATGVALDK